MKLNIDPGCLKETNTKIISKAANTPATINTMNIAGPTNLRFIYLPSNPANYFDNYGLIIHLQYFFDKQRELSTGYHLDITIMIKAVNQKPG